MIASGFEMLLYITLMKGCSEILRVSPQRIYRLRDKIARRAIGESELSVLLTNAGCEKVHDAYDIDAIVQDRGGRLMTERDFYKSKVKDELLSEMNIDVAGLRRLLGRNSLPKWTTSKRVFKKMHIHVVSERRHFDSVWSYTNRICDWDEKYAPMLSGIIGANARPQDSNRRSTFLYRQLLNLSSCDTD